MHSLCAHFALVGMQQQQLQMETKKTGEKQRNVVNGAAVASAVDVMTA